MWSGARHRARADAVRSVVLERRHGLAEIVERGVGVHVSAFSRKSSSCEREFLTLQQRVSSGIICVGTDLASSKRPSRRDFAQLLAAICGMSTFRRGCNFNRSALGRA